MRCRGAVTSSITSDEDSSSSYSNYSSDHSNRFSESSLSGDSPFLDNSLPDRRCHQHCKKWVFNSIHPTDMSFNHVVVFPIKNVMFNIKC